MYSRDRQWFEFWLEYSTELLLKLLKYFISINFSTYCVPMFVYFKTRHNHIWPIITNSNNPINQTEATNIYATGAKSGKTDNNVY